MLRLLSLFAAARASTYGPGNDAREWRPFDRLEPGDGLRSRATSRALCDQRWMGCPTVRWVIGNIVFQQAASAQLEPAIADHLPLHPDCDCRRQLEKRGCHEE